MTEVAHSIASSFGTAAAATPHVLGRSWHALRPPTRTQSPPPADGSSSFGLPPPPVLPAGSLQNRHVPGGRSAPEVHGQNPATSSPMASFSVPFDLDDSDVDVAQHTRMRPQHDEDGSDAGDDEAVDDEASTMSDSATPPSFQGKAHGMTASTGSEERNSPTAPASTTAPAAAARRSSLTSRDASMFRSDQSESGAGGGPFADLRRAKYGNVAPPGERTFVYVPVNLTNSGEMSSTLASGAPGSAPRQFILVSENLMDSAANPASLSTPLPSALSTPPSRSPSNDSGPGSPGSNPPSPTSPNDASHVLYLSTAATSQSVAGNSNSGGGGGMTTPSASVDAPLPVTLGHLDLARDPASLVNMLIHWVNRDCYWRSKDHARCMRERLAHIAAYAARQNASFLRKQAEAGVHADQLRRFRDAFATAEQQTRKLVESIRDDTPARHLQRTVLKFPAAVGAQNLAAYMVHQPDWNEMAQDYKTIIVDSDWERVGTSALTTPERMIARMSRSSLTSSR